MARLVSNETVLSQKLHRALACPHTHMVESTILGSEILIDHTGKRDQEPLFSVAGKSSDHD